MTTCSHVFDKSKVSVSVSLKVTLLYFKKRKKKSLEEAVEIHKKLDSLPIQQLFLLPAVEITFLLFPSSIQHTGCLFLCYPNEKL